METRRLLLAALLSLAVLLIWGYLFPPPPPPERPAPPPAAEEGVGEAPPGQAAPGRPAAGQPAPGQPGPGTPLPVAPGVAADAAPAEAPPVVEELIGAAEEEAVIETSRFRARFTNRGAQLLSFELLEHGSADGGRVDLVRGRASALYPFGLTDPRGTSLALNEALFTVERSQAEAGEEVLEYRYAGPAGVAEKRFTFMPNGLFEVEVSARGGGWALALGPGLRNPSAEELENRFARRGAIYRQGEEQERVDSQGAEETLALPGAGLRWLGLQDTYFLAAVVPQAGLETAHVVPVLQLDGGAPRFEPLPPADQRSAEQEELDRELLILLEPAGDSLAVASYWGGKRYDRLAALPYGLEATVELGFFRVLSLPLLWGLRWIHDNVVANYGWAIILMTVLIRLLLFPLTHKSTVSMQKMQELNPKVQAIRQKYRPKLKDKQGRPNVDMQRKMNEEMMALYKQEGVNPAGGCLPMVLQIPVLFAFYNLLSSAIELRHAPWVFWIQDLSAKDPWYVLPIVMGASQFLQQKMTPAAGDPMQRRLFTLMPIFFTVLFLGFPSGLVLYWLTNNLLGIGQQYAYKRSREARETSGEAPSTDPATRGSAK